MSSQTLTRFLCGAALVVPTLVLCASVTVGLVELSKAPIVRLPITGYDPVDLLHGHYIQFRFDNSVMKGTPPNSYFAFRSDDEASPSCVCLHRTQSESNGQNATVEYVKCKQKATLQCDGWTTNAEFFILAHKYFVDERYAAQLDKIVREATAGQRNTRSAWIGNTPNPALTSPKPVGDQAQPAAPDPLSRVTIDLAVSSSGALQFKMLNIDGKSWMDFVTDGNQAGRFP
jgi:hypothetical protein